MQQQATQPVVNGTALDSLDAVAEAFSYLGKGYNDGDIIVRRGMDRIFLESRRSTMEHWAELRDSTAIEVARVSATNDGRARVELTEADN